MSEGPGGPQGATAGGTLAMRMLSQQAMVASQMKRAANDKAIAQMLAAKKSGPPAARLGDEIQHKSFLGALAGAVLGAIVTIAEGCLIMAACATGPYALVLVPALMYASYKASDYVEEKQNQLESWINSFCDTDGAINTGSENVKLTASWPHVQRSPFPLLLHLEQYLKSHRGNPHGVILPLTCLNRQRKKQYHWRRPGGTLLSP